MIKKGFLNTAEDVKDHKELVSSLCFQEAVDLFDAVETIDIVLERQNGSYGCHGNPQSQGLGWVKTKASG